MTEPEVLYEQGPCLVVNKPSGVLTQAPAGIDSMEVRVREYFRRCEKISADAGIYVGIPHRLDRPVSGALAFARHVRAAQRIASQFERRTVGKTYWAVVAGAVDPDEGTWCDYLHKRHGLAQTEIVPPDHPAAKHAVLHYRVRGRTTTLTWLEIELETGRTHQIRVQAGSRGFPVVGDAQYGSDMPFGPATDEPRDRPIALHARDLSFRHPMVDEEVRVTAPLPAPWGDLAFEFAG